MVRSFLRPVALGAVLLLVPGCGSPTEPNAPKTSTAVSFKSMSLVVCESDRRSFVSPDFQFTLTGQAFDMKIAGVGNAHGTITDDQLFGTFSITLDAPCAGSGSGLFQLSSGTQGSTTVWTASGLWNTTITESGPGCACPVGPGTARFTLG